jgi:hypothetical protein
MSPLYRLTPLLKALLVLTNANVGEHEEMGGDSGKCFSLGTFEASDSFCPLVSNEVKDHLMLHLVLLPLNNRLISVMNMIQRFITYIVRSINMPWIPALIPDLFGSGTHLLFTCGVPHGTHLIFRL